MASHGLHPVTRAAAWMSGALLSLAAMAIASREAAAHLSVFQILFFRSACGLLVVCLILWRTGWVQVRTQRLPGHVVRNVSHFGAQYGWVYGIIYIPMAAVIAIEFTTPVWTILLAAALLGEKVRWPRAVSVLLGLCGVYLIVQPGAGGSGAPLHPAALAVLGSAVAFALAHTMTKRLSPTESPLCILFYMNAIQMALGSVPSLFDWRDPPLAALPYVVVIGLVSLSTHYCLARAMKLADATIVVPLDFLRLPFIAVLGALLYGESVESSMYIGAGLILAGNLFSIVMERRRGKTL